MFGRKQRKIEKLKSRVYELEEILCPCSQHDLIQVDSITHYGDNPQSITYTRIMQCRKCKKIIRKWEH